jgi:thiamine pyrophosphate-dependent acetolactate synthase large subunit-like protein
MKDLIKQYLDRGISRRDLLSGLGALGITATTAYIGDPDVDFAKVASGFGVEAETVTEPSAFRPALERAKRATVDGRPYLLDVQVQRDGFGAASTWHPSYSIAALRQRKV